MYIVTVGLCDNPISELSFHGPFKSMATAMKYGDKHIKNDSWWIKQVIKL